MPGNALAILTLGLSVNTQLKQQYFPLSEPTTYDDAASQCVSAGGTLASFHSKNEFLAAQRACKTSCLSLACGCWVGLKGETAQDIWRWEDNTAKDYALMADGEAVGFYPWFPGEPSNLAKGEHCVHIWQSQAYLLNDISCVSSNYPLCQYTEEQMSQAKVEAVENGLIGVGKSVEETNRLFDEDVAMMIVPLALLLIGAAAYFCYKHDGCCKEKFKDNDVVLDYGSNVLTVQY